jgi:iron(III) transport system permease protein
MRLISLLRLWVFVLLAMPVLMVLAAWLQWNEASANVLLGMASTVLPSYVVSSLGLCFWVAIGVISMGSVSAAAVTLFDFKGRRTLEWALLLPLAMPAYVVAYAYSDFLQFSGPLQTALRAALGWQGALWPDVRSLWGAAAVLSLALYPYVYLLVRAALVERAPQLMEAARLLGADLPRRIFRVALPLARPAIAAGTALALMETLADFGVSSYFGVTTFSTGIYKAWLVMDDRVAAAQLATFCCCWWLRCCAWSKKPKPGCALPVSAAWAAVLSHSLCNCMGFPLRLLCCCVPCRCCWGLFCPC